MVNPTIHTQLTLGLSQPLEGFSEQNETLDQKTPVVITAYFKIFRGKINECKT
jgi:hypothetical protein